MAGLYRNPVTGQYQFNYSQFTWNDPCKVDGTFLTNWFLPGPPWVLVATVHPHPFAASDMVPSNCDASIAGSRVGVAEWTPSSFDWNTARGKGVYGYIISPHFVTRFDAQNAAAADRANWPSLTAKWSWNEDHGCRWAGMRAAPF